jgi:hypothetical protein
MHKLPHNPVTNTPKKQHLNFFLYSIISIKFIHKGKYYTCQHGRLFYLLQPFAFLHRKYTANHLLFLGFFLVQNI